MSNKIGVKAGQKSIVPSKPSSKKSLQPNTTVSEASKPTAKASTAKTKPAVKKPGKKQEQPTKDKPKKTEAKKELSGLSVKLRGDGISIRWLTISKEVFDSLTRKCSLWESGIWESFYVNCNTVIGGNANESCYAEIDQKKLILTDPNQWFISAEAKLKLMRSVENRKRKLISIDASHRLSRTTKIEIPRGQYLLVRIGGLTGDYVSMSNPDGKKIAESDFDVTIERVIAPDGWIYNVASLRSKNSDNLADDGDFYYRGTERYGWDVYDPTGKRHDVNFKKLRGPKTRCGGLVLPYWQQAYEGQEKDIAKSKIFQTGGVSGATASI